jgi:hypothetical protein
MSVKPRKSTKEVFAEGDFVDVPLDDSPAASNSNRKDKSLPSRKWWQFLHTVCRPPAPPTIMSAEPAKVSANSESSENNDHDVSGGKSRLTGGEDDGCGCGEMCVTFVGAVLCWWFCCEDLYD